MSKSKNKKGLIGSVWRLHRDWMFCGFRPFSEVEIMPEEAEMINWKGSSWYGNSEGKVCDIAKNGNYNPPSSPPEYRLLIALLERFVHDLACVSDRHVVTSALRWYESREEHFFSFRNVCEVLDLSAHRMEKVRKMVFEARNRPENGQ